MNFFKPSFIFFLGFILLMSSCKKEGCIDVFANNYSSDAVKDDGSCSYQSDYFVGRYAIIDSITGGMIPGKWSAERNYTIEIVQNQDNLSEIIIKNWANISSNTDSPTQLIAQVDGDNFFIRFQEITNTKGYTSQTSSGIVFGDSIYYIFSYQNAYGEVFGGNSKGTKIE